MSSKLHRHFGALFLLLLIVATGLQAREKQPVIRIAAASSLQFALAALISQYDPAGIKIAKPVYGASGNLFRQIMQGAPIDVFLSADKYLIKKLQANDRVSENITSLGHSSLVLYQLNASQAGSSSAKPFGLSGLVDSIETQEVFKLAIANPRHAPYGVAAQQALEQLGLWEDLQPHIVYGEKVSQAAMMVVSGAARYGIISQSLALSPVLSRQGRFVLLPADSHTSILLQAVAVGVKQQQADNFLHYLTTDAARAILHRYGVAR